MCSFSHSLRVGPELTAPVSRPLTLGPVASYKRARKFDGGVFQRAPLAQKPWRVTMKHKGHRHMDPIQHAMLGLKPQQRGGEKK